MITIKSLSVNLPSYTNNTFPIYSHHVIRNGRLIKTKLSNNYFDKFKTFDEVVAKVKELRVKYTINEVESTFHNDLKKCHTYNIKKFNGTIGWGVYRLTFHGEYVEVKRWIHHECYLTISNVRQLFNDLNKLGLIYNWLHFSEFLETFQNKYNKIC